MCIIQRTFEMQNRDIFPREVYHRVYLFRAERVVKQQRCLSTVFSSSRQHSIVWPLLIEKSQYRQRVRRYFSVVTVLGRGPEAEVETTVAGVRFDLGPGVGREGLSLRDPAAGLVDYSHWLTALRYLTVTFEDDEKKSWEKTLRGIYLGVSYGHAVAH